MGIFKFLKRIFAEPITIADITIPTVSKEVDTTPDDGWYDFDENDPPSGVVIGACDTYDCGWSFSFVWWNFTERCWMVSGASGSEYGNLSYTKWRDPPNEPK